MSESLRIFLVDDHEVLREGLKLLINGQPDMEVVGEASNGRSACKQVKTLRPEVVVMDISMPDMNGMEATKRLKQECPEVKVMALTAHEDQAYLRQLLQTGASGYVLKSAPSKELIHAIRVVAVGQTYLDPSVTSRVVSGFIGRQSGPLADGEMDLSDRETEVLRLIALGHSNKEIAAQLDISVKTVETYKSRLMDKLDLHSRADIVRYALRQGWLRDT